VTAVTQSSNDLISGVAFVAKAGPKADGHSYVPNALARGAILVVGERPQPPDCPSARAYAQAADVRARNLELRPDGASP